MPEEIIGIKELPEDKIQFLIKMEKQGKLNEPGLVLLDQIRRIGKAPRAIISNIDWDTGAPARLRGLLSFTENPDIKTQIIKKAYPEGEVSSFADETVYRESPTERWKAVDEAHFTGRDFLDYISSGPELALGTAGGMVGGIPGAGIGMAGGTALKQLIGSKLGVPQGTPQERLTDIGISGITGAGSELIPKMGASGAKLLAEKMLGLGRGRYPAAQQIVKLGEREGIPLMAPDVTGNRPQAIIHSTLDKLLFGSGTMQKAASEQMEELGKYGLRTRGREVLGPDMAASIREGLEESWNVIKSKSDVLFDDAKQAAIDKAVKLSETSKTVNNIVKSKDFKYLAGESKQILKNIFDDIEESKGKILKWSDVEGMRKGISDISFPKEISGTSATRMANQVRNAILDDMEKSAKDVGSDVYKLYKKARGFYSENVMGKFKGETEQFKKAIGTRILHSTDEQLFGMIKNNNVTNLQELKAILPPKRFEDVKQGWITNLFEKGQTTIKGPKGEIQSYKTQTMNTLWNKTPEKFKEELFSPVELKNIDDFMLLARSSGTAEKLAGNPSGTAQTIMAGGLLTGIGSGAGMLTEGREGAAVGGLLGGISPFLLAKLVTSGWGKRLLIEGIKPMRPITRNIIRPFKMGMGMGAKESIMEE